MTSERHAPSSDVAAVPPGGSMPPAASDDPILAAARSLALDVGFRRATLADVARRAGVSRMTVYRQYDDIGAIWSRLLTDELVGLLDDSAADLAALPTARERLVQAAVVLVDGISQHPLLRRALDLDPELVLPLVVDRLGSTQRAALARIEGLLRDGVADGSVRADLDPVPAAYAVLLAVQSFIFSARVVDSRPDAADVRAEVVPLIDRYLAP
jgi:AcrR family transcriptional regulator